MTLLPCVSLLRTTLAVLKYEYLVLNVTRALPYLTIVKYSPKEVIPYILFASGPFGLSALILNIFL